MFRVFGIGDLADKARQDFTSEDVSPRLSLFWVCTLPAGPPSVCPDQCSYHPSAYNPKYFFKKGLKALGALRAFARRAVERLGDVSDPGRLAGVMQGYAEMMDSDDTLREMAARVEVSRARVT